MNSELVILSSLKNINDEIIEVRKELKTQSKILSKLESSYLINENKCALTHKILDEKVDKLINEKIKKEVVKRDWKTWGYRIVIMIPISALTTVVTLVLKGCI